MHKKLIEIITDQYNGKTSRKRTGNEQDGVSYCLKNTDFFPGKVKMGGVFYDRDGDLTGSRLAAEQARFSANFVRQTRSGSFSSRRDVDANVPLIVIQFSKSSCNSI